MINVIKSYYPSQRREAIGKSNLQALLIKLALSPTGLPKTNLIFARYDHMIKWDCDTGEVSTVQYDQRL